MAESRGRGSVVEHNLAKVGVAGSNPVVRSIRCRQTSTLPGSSIRGVSYRAPWRWRSGGIAACGGQLLAIALPENP